MQLRVKKRDGSCEVYLHTKVMGTLAAALSDCEMYEPGAPEQLSEAVTTFLRHRYGSGMVGSDEIHAMIEAVLTDTGYVSAALTLQEHRNRRELMRSRMEVMHCQYEGHEYSLRGGGDAREASLIEPWDKSAIVRSLEGKRGLVHSLARAVAGSVEEKVLPMRCRCVTTGLVRELVESDLLAMRRAELALAEDSRKEIFAEPVLATG